ncbi:MAG: pantoate--beta-alanine ligase [Rhodospirillaceae bacterium]|nr:MAG: pantoate--beta-alanine ligase [Rhodospirillaceae bacterium]
MAAADADSTVIVRDIDALRRRIGAWRRDHQSVALVPTMGALHNGHLTLMARAQQMADRVVATIFVNPKQFGPREDLAAYPRQESTDFQMLAAAGVHLLFAPDVATMYPKGYATSVRVAGLSTMLDGAHRRGHFDGVTTVVTKLLLQAGPNIALFGEKDYQQLTIIKRLAVDLNIPVDIIGVPTVREGDGLAMSSRNAYLTAAERARAPALYRAITAAAADIAAGGDITAALAVAREKILQAGFSKIDYVDARHEETLARLKSIREPGRILAAAHMGNARLIDNVAIQRV